MRKRQLAATVLLVLSLLLVFTACESTTLPLDEDVLALLLDNACADYDVVVIGGEPEGVAAAIAAARSGQRTLLLVAEPALGGLFTFGMLNFLDLSYAPGGGLANTGIFLEFYRRVGNSDAFDVEQAKQVFADMVAAEELLTVKFGRTLLRTVTDASGYKILAVQMQSQQAEEIYLTPMLIDATADADVAAASGVSSTYMREDYGDHDAGMAVTLVLPFKNVNWASLQAAAASGRWGYANSHSKAAWGFSRVASAYKPHNEGARMRGLNIGRQADGTVLINALQIFGVDPLDADSRQAGIELGKAEAEHVLTWFRENMGGFEQAELGEFPTSLYIRESRHIIGEYILTVHDVLENRMFPDAIAFGSYPIDVQASSPVELGFVVGAPNLYSIPLRSLIPLQHENLLVAGKAASFTSLAAGSARVVPIGMSTGQAAGVAASVALREGVSLQACNEAEYYQAVQAELKQQGVRFFSGDYGSAYPEHPHTPALKRMVELGLAAGGYSNQFPLASTLRERDFVGVVATGIQRILPRPNTAQASDEEGGQAATSDEAIGEHMRALQEERARIKQIASRVYAAGFNIRTLEWSRATELLTFLFRELGKPELSEWLYEKTEDQVGHPTRGQAYSLLVEVFERLQE